MKKKRALISVYHKDGIEKFAAGLQKLGIEVVSSGGTAKFLKEKKLTDIIEVEDITGYPSILDDRVKTLHPKIHAGILADRTEEHNKQLLQYKIERFHIVCVDLYPVITAINSADCTMEKVLNLTDIGGPTMLRGAAKNWNNGVTVICDPADRNRVLDELEAMGEVSDELRLELAKKVFLTMAKYDMAIAKFLSEEEDKHPYDAIFMEHVRDLPKGENAYQQAALYKTDNDYPLALHRFNLISGDPGYVNTADGDRMLQTITLMAEAFRRNFNDKVPYIVIVCKHGNACGAAYSWDSPEQAVLKALLGDYIAAMGGEIMANFPITEDIAKLLRRVPKIYRKQVGRLAWGADVIYVPGFEQGAFDVLHKKKTTRGLVERPLLVNPDLENPIMPPYHLHYRPVLGGELVQSAPDFVYTPQAVQSWTGDGKLSSTYLGALILAWATAWRADSNTVNIAKDNMLIGAGVGQKDRITCCELALRLAKRAGHDIRNSFFASDAFFPYAERKTAADFLEGTELLQRAGSIGGIVPADGKELENVKAFFHSHHMKVAFLDPKYRGFFGH